MRARVNRLLFWAVPAVLLAGGLWLAFRPQPAEVDIVTVAEGPLAVTLAEEGRTRIRDVFVVSAPVGGRVLRARVEEGDRVAAGETVLTEIEPADPAFLDPRSETEARRAVAAAQAGVALAEAQIVQARADLDYAAAELARTRGLHARGVVAERVLDEAQRLNDTRAAALRAAEAVLAMRRAELSVAEARLMRPGAATAWPDGCPCLPVTAPVGGQVLRVLQESETVVAAGQPLFELGDPRELEIVTDYPSADAVRIAPGQRVIVGRWGGGTDLAGEVIRVEPYGTTRVSALGIEEQRVNVVIRLTDPPEAWARLGHGFEVETRVVVWESDSVVKVPLTALFRDDGDWAVFRVEGDRAVLQPVTPGPRADLEAAVLSGLAPGDRILRYPHDAIAPGQRLRPR